MKCPMQTVIPKASPTNLIIDFFECLGEECAWYDEAEAQCAFLSFATWMPHIVKLLRSFYELAKK